MEMTGDAMQALSGIISTGINAAAQGVANVKNRKFAKQQALQAQKWTVNNMKLAHDWAVEDARKADVYKVESLKSAGLNPMLAYEGSNNLGITSAPAGSAGNPVDSKSPLSTLAQGVDFASLADMIRTADRNDDLAESNIEVNKSVAAKNYADAGKSNIETQFLEITLDSRVGLTESESKRIQTINHYMLSDPENAKAIAESQKKLNNQVDKHIEEISKNIDLIESNIGRNKYENRKIAAETALAYVQATFTESQRQMFEDKNFREHYNDIGWLTKEWIELENASKGEEESEALNEKLAILKACIEEVGNKESQQRQHSHESAITNRHIKLQNRSIDVHEKAVEYDRVLRSVQLGIQTFNSCANFGLNFVSPTQQPVNPIGFR